MAVSALLLSAVFSFITSLNGQLQPPLPGSCPEGMVFKSCGTACPRTCSNLGEQLFCTRQCVIGCFCARGTVLNGDLCVQPSDCPSTEGPSIPTPTQVSSSPTSSTVITQHIATTMVLHSTMDSNASPQNNIAIIVGSSVAAVAAVATMLLLLSILVFMILVRKAKSKIKLEKMPSIQQHITNGISFDKRNEADVDFIPVGTNEAYATTEFMRGNIAYSAAANSSNDDYEEYI